MAMNNNRARKKTRTTEFNDNGFTKKHLLFKSSGIYNHVQLATFYVDGASLNLKVVLPFYNKIVTPEQKVLGRLIVYPLCRGSISPAEIPSNVLPQKYKSINGVDCSVLPPSSLFVSSSSPSNSYLN